MWIPQADRSRVPGMVPLQHPFRKLAATTLGVLILASLSGCAVDFARLKMCEESGLARFEAIPIGSRSEHAQAEAFVPSDPGRCLVYVIRGRDAWTGRSVRRTQVTLTPIGEVPDASLAVGASPGGALAITDHIYALWVLSPGTYLLKADFGSSIPTIAMFPSAQRRQEHDRLQFECRAGDVLFFLVDDRGFSHYAVVGPLDPTAGQALVRQGIRSVGDRVTSPPYFSDCAGTW